MSADAADGGQPAIVELLIETLGADAAGLARIRPGEGNGAGGGVSVRVPFTLPGERVRARVHPSQGDTTEAELLEVLQAAATRVQATCALFQRCGGCQLQHASYQAQLDWKTAAVRALFAAWPVKVAPCLGSPRPYGYRSKITPHFPRPRGGRVPPVGFLRAGRRNETLDVADCPLATDGIRARLPEVRAEVAARVDSYRRGATLLLREAASGVTTDPKAVITEQVGALALTFLAGDFFQNNPFLLPRLADHVAAEAGSGGAPFLVDAYCGSGLLGLTAAPAFQRVVGVEVSESSVRWARENAARNRRDNCTFIAADAAAVFAGIPFGGGDSAVIVDPPRKGCSPAFLQQLVAFAPRTIVYVSCNPETQVRDLHALGAAGYLLGAVQPFDMFPQTRHLESVATLARVPTGTSS